MPEVRTDAAGRRWVPSPPPEEEAASWRATKWNVMAQPSDLAPYALYSLEYRSGLADDPGWYLYGNHGSVFGKFMSRRLADAVEAADPWLTGKIYDVPGEESGD